MPTPITKIAPLFIVRDIFFGIVERDGAMIMLKDIDIDPAPNHSFDIGHGIALWDAYCHTPDPDALAAELAARGVTFRTPLGDNSDNLRGFEVQDINGYVLYFGRPNG